MRAGVMREGWGANDRIEAEEATARETQPRLDSADI